MRLKARHDSGMKVPDLADTVGPVSESNCIGAIPPGGEQLEEKFQAVTTRRKQPPHGELVSVGACDESAEPRRNPNKIEPTAPREWIAAGGQAQMFGDGMEGSHDDVNQGTTVDGEKQIRRGQSTRSSCEASNDRGAKGCRKVVEWKSAGPHKMAGKVPQG